MTPLSTYAPPPGIETDCYNSIEEHVQKFTQMIQKLEKQSPPKATEKSMYREKLMKFDDDGPEPIADLNLSRT